MKLSDFRKMIDGMPKGSSFVLPVDEAKEWEWLNGGGNGLEQDLTVADVATRFGRASQTVCRWIRDGRLDAYHFLGNEYRITESAVEEFQSKERLNRVED